VTDGRSYTREEAEAELDVLRELLPRLREARRAIIDAGRLIEEAVAIDGGGTEGSAWFRHQATLRQGLEELARKDIALRNPETGLVDFPATIDGRPVFLCWKLGERGIGFFHETNAGYGGRQPL